MALSKRNVTEAPVEEVKEAAQTPEDTVENLDESEVEVEVEDVIQDVEVEDVRQDVEDEEFDEIYPSPHTATPVATTNNNSALAQLAEEGAEGLEIDWTSFPTIVLDKGEFCTSDETELGVEKFQVSIRSTRKKYAVRSKHEDEEDAEIAYCYNLSDITTEGTQAYDKVKQWKEEEGVGYEIKEYLDAICVILDDTLADLIGPLAILQIPPASRGKLSGHLQGTKMITELALGSWITEVSRGNKVTKSKHSFYPWAFKYIGPING